MTDKDKGIDPPGEVFWVTYPHSKGHDLLEERRCHHCQELNPEHVYYTIQMILKLRKLTEFWCSRRPERDRPNFQLGSPGEFQEGPIAGYQQRVCPLVFLAFVEGLLL